MIDDRDDFKGTRFNGEGAPGAKKVDEVPPGVVPVRYPAKEFNLQDVVSIPCQEARFIVRVDGKDYAGFDDKMTALDAMHAWRQRWPAVAGKTLDLKEY